MRPSGVFGAVALAVLATMSSQFSARAADIAVPPAQPASTYIPAIFSWTGWYLGIEAGGGFGNADWTDTFNPAVTATVSPSGFLVGGYSGINYQMGSFVIGIDIDFDGTWVNGSTTDAASSLLQTKVFWTSTASGRLGVAFDRVLLYFKAGGAFAYDRNFITVGGNQSLGTTSRIGWNAGGGVDYAFTDHWTARLEYDYLSLENQNVPFGGRGGVGGTSSISLKLNEAKAGLAYKF
jgi:outer membrane immunogenic protein